MALTRKVVGTVRKPSGLPHVGVQVSFALIPGSYTATDQFPQGRIDVVTDENGAFEATLWTNEVGDEASAYVCRMPGDGFRFTLPAGSTQIELSLLRQAGLVPGDPQYNTLITWLLDQFKGPWTATSYAHGNTVTHDSTTWIALDDTAPGDEPGVSALWVEYVLPGEKGDQGDPGPIGPAGTPDFHPFLLM